MIKAAYGLLRFGFELACIALVGYWGFSLTGLGGWRRQAGIGAALVLVGVWAVWMAPSSQFRLSGAWRLGAELLIYAVLAMLLYHSPLRHLTPWFGLVAVANALVNHLTGWLI